MLVCCRINDNFCSLLESGPKPTVAAVESMALGGGLETAMACNARICTPGKPACPKLLLHWHVFDGPSAGHGSSGIMSLQCCNSKQYCMRTQA